MPVTALARVAPAVTAEDGLRPGLRAVLIGLCVTEITSWGILYYAFPVLAPAIEDDTGWSAPATTAAFSAALIVAAIGGVPLGRVLDRRGPRAAMTWGSVLATVAVLAVAAARTSGPSAPRGCSPGWR